MSEPFLGELKIVSFGFPPKGWTTCDGQLLPINQNQALFSLLGTTFGGDGRVTFGLPDLRSRIPVHDGNGHTLGERGGEQAHTLSISEIPTHTHSVMAATDAADSIKPSGHYPTTTAANMTLYNNAGSGLAAMRAGTLANVGGSQAHLNQQPFLVLNWIIALQGIFPSQT